MDELNIFCQRLVEARKNMGFTQKGFAELLNITPTRLNLWEKGKREPDVSMIRKIAKKLEVSTDYLLGLTDIHTPSLQHTENDNCKLLLILIDTILDRMETGGYSTQIAHDIIDIFYDISEIIADFNSIRLKTGAAEDAYFSATQHHLSAQEYLQKLLKDLKVEILSNQPNPITKQTLQSIFENFNKRPFNHPKEQPQN